MEIAVLDASAEADKKDVLFAVAAVAKQMREHIAPAYEEEPFIVVYYRDVKDIPPEAYYVLVIVDEVPAGELGDHDALRTARVLFKGDPDWVSVLSHEIAEMFGNISCNLWLPHPARPGYKLARELSDPCQTGRYPIDVTILGETRTLVVSDFVLPAYWVAGAPAPYNYLDTMEIPGEILPGGYQIVRGPDGVVDDLWAAGERGTPGPRGALVRAKGVAGA
jgi:hypothetical protein